MALATRTIQDLATSERWGISRTIRHQDGTVILKDASISQAREFITMLHGVVEDKAPVRMAKWALISGAVIPDDVLDALNLTLTDHKPLPTR